MEYDPQGKEMLFKTVIESLFTSGKLNLGRATIFWYNPSSNII
jgi:hypothetical protein